VSVSYNYMGRGESLEKVSCGIRSTSVEAKAAINHSEVWGSTTGGKGGGTKTVVLWEREFPVTLAASIR